MNLFNIVFALIPQRSVDSLVSSLSKLVVKLEKAEAKAKALQDKHYAKVTQVSKAYAEKIAELKSTRDEIVQTAHSAAEAAEAEAQKAARVASKIKDLVS